MTKPETIALHTIYDNIKNGFIYGYYYEPTNPALKEDKLFWVVMSLTIHNNIYWNNYGSSATKASIKNLKWLLDTIFGMTATEFMEKYTTRI